MIQDIEPLQLNNQYMPEVSAGAGDLVLSLRDGKALCALSEEIVFPTAARWTAAGGGALRYAFSVGEERYFLPEGDLPETVDGFEYRTLAEIRSGGSGPMYRHFVLYTGKHLSDWYRDTRFCGRCGTATRHSEKERAMVCPACGYTAYPRIMPAVIVGVKNGDSLLLTRYRTGYGHNALIAGFTEIGETLEQTVSREVMEEAGIRVKNIRYYRSQPWGVANDILIGYTCEVDGEDTIRMDANELKEARWVPRQEIELQPDHYSLTNEIMERFKNGAW